MNGFSTLMFIFAILVFLTGLYAYTGHKIGIMTYRAAFRKTTKEEWRNIGKWTMIVSIFIFIIAIIGLFLDI